MWRVWPGLWDRVTSIGEFVHCQFVLFALSWLNPRTGYHAAVLRFLEIDSEASLDVEVDVHTKEPAKKGGHLLTLNEEKT